MSKSIKDAKSKFSCYRCSKHICCKNRFINCKICNHKLHLKCNTLNHRRNNTNPNNMCLDICFSCSIKNSKCGICTKKISSNHRHIECTKCYKKIHIKCNNTSQSSYNNMLTINTLCINCKPDIFSFHDLSEVLIFN